MQGCNGEEDSVGRVVPCGFGWGVMDFVSDGLFERK